MPQNVYIPDLEHGIDGSLNNPSIGDNLLKFIRMQSLFDPNANRNVGPDFNAPIQFGTSMDVQGTMPQQTIQDSPVPNQGRRLEDIYKPEHMATDKMWEMINSMPTKENYKPSIWRKIGAGLVGAGHGPEAGSAMLNKPYNTAMADWKMRFDPLNTVAAREQAANTSNRQWSTEVLKDEDRDTQLKINEQKARTSEERAKAYIALQNFKMDPKNQDWEVVKVEGGNYTLINPKTGESKDTGIKTGTLTQIEEINTKVKGQKEVAAIPRTTNTIGNTTSTTVTPPGSDPAKDKVDQYNRARELANNPQGAKMIHLGDPGTNDFVLDIPANGASNEEWTAYKDAYRHIYRRQPMFDQTPGGTSEAGKPIGEQPGDVTKTTTSNRNSTSTSVKGAIPKAVNSPPTNVTQGKRVTIYKNGKAVGTIPDTPAQRESAKKQGYVVR